MLDRLDNARLIVDKIGELPPFPSVIMKVLQLLNDPATSVQAIQDKVLLDPSLTSLFLKVANSALYAVSNEVTTVQYAIRLMGYDTARMILMAYMSKSVYSQGSSLIRSILWKHALSSAVFAEKIAAHNRKANLEEAFIAALLHDIGKGVLTKNKPREFDLITEAIFNEGKLSVDVEQHFLGYTHIEVGFLLMKKWNFPERMIEALVYHHSPLEYGGDNVLVNITSLANKLSHLNNYNFNKWFEGWEQDIPELKLLGISESQLQELSAAAVKEIEETLSVFEKV
jgi:putative nucleotidyltransferase with HDIG domain